jgi:hypothetical protein
VDQEILRHIWEQRPLLGVKAGVACGADRRHERTVARTRASSIHARVGGAARRGSERSTNGCARDRNCLFIFCSRLRRGLGLNGTRRGDRRYEFSKSSSALS